MIKKKTFSKVNGRKLLCLDKTYLIYYTSKHSKYHILNVVKLPTFLLKAKNNKGVYQPHIYQFNIVLEVLANTQNTFPSLPQKMIEKEKKVIS